MPKLFKSLAVLLALPLVLAGCKIDSINYFPPTPAHIRIVNVLGTTTPINVAANGVTIWSGLNFEAMTGYVDFENVTTKITVSLAGSNDTLVEQTIYPTGNQNSTLVVYGTVFSPSIGVMVDVPSPPPSGKFELNLFNVAPVGNGTTVGIYPIDVYVTPVGQALENTSPTFTTINYSNANIFGSFSAGQYQLRLTVAGTKILIYDSGPLTFQEKTATDLIIYSRGSYLLANVLLNDSDGAGKQVIANSRLARLKVVNGAFQTGNVNQSLNGTTSVSDLPYTSASLYKFVESGQGTVAFEASSAPGAIIASLANPFVAATDQSIFVTGFAGATSAVALNDDNLPPASNAAAVRFVNTSPDSAPLDVYASDTLLAKAVGTYAASAYVQLLSGTYTLVFKDSVTGATVLTLSNLTLNAQQTYSVYAMGSAAGTLSGLTTADTP
jgi:hypothetical protein